MENVTPLKGEPRWGDSFAPVGFMSRWLNLHFQSSWQRASYASFYQSVAERFIRRYIRSCGVFRTQFSKGLERPYGAKANFDDLILVGRVVDVVSCLVFSVHGAGNHSTGKAIGGYLGTPDSFRYGVPIECGHDRFSMDGEDGEALLRFLFESGRSEFLWNYCIHYNSAISVFETKIDFLAGLELISPAFHARQSKQRFLDDVRYQYGKVKNYKDRFARKHGDRKLAHIHMHGEFKKFVSESAPLYKSHWIDGTPK